MFKNILIATDGSGLSKKAVKEGVRLAKSLGVRIIAVHVYPAHFGLSYGNLSVIDERTQDRLRKQAREEGARYLEQACAAAEAAGVECERVLLENDSPWKGIVNTARRKRADLIMMAAHGRKGLSALVLGSETNKVLVNSKIPVLVYR